MGVNTNWYTYFACRLRLICLARCRCLRLFYLACRRRLRRLGLARRHLCIGWARARGRRTEGRRRRRGLAPRAPPSPCAASPTAAAQGGFGMDGLVLAAVFARPKHPIHVKHKFTALTTPVPIPTSAAAAPTPTATRRFGGTDPCQPAPGRDRRRGLLLRRRRRCRRCRRSLLICRCLRRRRRRLRIRRCLCLRVGRRLRGFRVRRLVRRPHVGLGLCRSLQFAEILARLLEL